MTHNYLPSWEELKAFELVYVSSTRNEEVASRKTLVRLVNILNSTCSNDYRFTAERDQQEFTKSEYNNCVSYEGPMFLSFMTYEEMARNDEIRARILAKLKREDLMNQKYN